MQTNSRQIKRRLEGEGWVLERVNGSHHIFKHPEIQTRVVLPHPKKSIPIGTIHNIYRAAGWEKD